MAIKCRHLNLTLDILSMTGIRDIRRQRVKLPYHKHKMFPKPDWDSSNTDLPVCCFSCHIIYVTCNEELKAYLVFSSTQYQYKMFQIAYNPVATGL